MTKTVTKRAVRSVAKASKAKATPRLTLEKPILSAIKAEAVASELVEAAISHSSADGTLLERVMAAVRGLKPMTAAQYDRALGGTVKAMFANASKAGRLAETSVPGYASRFKTLTLAITCGIKPNRGEAYTAFLSRAAGELPKAKANGVPVYDPTKVRPGRAVGTSTRKTIGGASGGPTGGHVEASKADGDKDAGGMNVRPMLAAAMILAKGETRRAQRLALVCEHHAADLDKWMDAILSDDDKAKLNARAADLAKANAAKASGNADPTPKPVNETALASAMRKAEVKATTKAA